MEQITIIDPLFKVFIASLCSATAHYRSPPFQSGLGIIFQIKTNLA
jgi:hypothetical protein